MGRDHRPTYLVLRSSDEVEKCLGVDWGSVFTED